MENQLEGVPGRDQHPEVQQGISQSYMDVMMPEQKEEEPQQEVEQEVTDLGSVDDVDDTKGNVPDVDTPTIEMIQNDPQDDPAIDLPETKQGLAIPENLGKLVSFMQETNGSIEDYINLNKDVSKMDDNDVLRDYYRKKSPHLDEDDIGFMMNKKFLFDEEVDDDDEVRGKKIAMKEELYDARNYLTTQRDQYYAEIKSAGSASGVDLVAQAKNKELSEHFTQQTDQFFNEDFKGFEFSLGEGKPNLRYKINNADSIKSTQMDFNNVVGEFLDEGGKLKDAQSYHKGLFMMRNGDKVAQLMYDQGYAMAVEELTKNSKNTDFTPQHNELSSNTKLAPGVAREITQENVNSGTKIQSRFRNK